MTRLRNISHAASAWFSTIAAKFWSPAPASAESGLLTRADVDSLWAQADVLTWQGQFHEGELLCRKALDILNPALNENDTMRATGFQNLAQAGYHTS